VLSLVGKVAVTVAPSAAGRADVARTTVGASVQTALIGLGWSERVAAQAVEEILAGSTAEFDAEAAGVSAVLRLALARLGPAQHATTTTGAGEPS
jgi:Holliday junction DNA helicase RuvA